MTGNQGKAMPQLNRFPRLVGRSTLATDHQGEAYFGCLPGQLLFFFASVHADTRFIPMMALLVAYMRELRKFHALTIGCFAFLLFMQHETDSRARPVRVIHPTI